MLSICLPMKIRHLMIMSVSIAKLDLRTYKHDKTVAGGRIFGNTIGVAAKAGVYAKI